MSLEYDYELYTLTNDFYQDYPSSQYPELLTPHGNRTYNCLIFDFKDYFICIPYRSNMKHKNGYSFTNTQRAKRAKSGLDYSKLVIIKDFQKYLSRDNNLVDNDEYKETLQNLDRIAQEVVEYIDKYIKHCKNQIKLNNQEYNKKYKYSTLHYFHDLLNI